MHASLHDVNFVDILIVYFEFRTSTMSFCGNCVICFKLQCKSEHSLCLVVNVIRPFCVRIPMKVTRALVKIVIQNSQEDDYEAHRNKRVQRNEAWNLSLRLKFFNVCVF